MMRGTAKSTLAVIFVVIITFCAVIIADHAGRFWRIDLTEDNIYTLSDGTGSVIEGLNRPVTFKLYYSRTSALKGPEFLRSYNAYYLYVRDLLREYERLSGGKIHLDVIDPRPDTDDEMDAVRYGLKYYSTGEEPFFFGIAAVTEFGQEKVIPFLVPDRQELIEYDTSSTLYDVSAKTRKKIGVLSSLNLFGDNLSPYMARMMGMQGRKPEEAWNIVKQLKSLYEVVPVPVDAQEIEGFDLLLVVHPKDLTEITLFAIDQFVVRGGKMIVFVDPYCMSDVSGAYGSKSSDLNRLTDAWGCSMPAGDFAADREQCVTIRGGEGGRGRKLVTFIDLQNGSFNREDVVTAKLDTVRVLFAGVLKKTEAENIKAEQLLMTSASAGLVKADSADLAVRINPDAMDKNLEEKDGPLVLAYKLTGKFESAFPEGITVTSEEGEAGGKMEKIEGFRKTAEETTVIVCSDADLISDFVAFQEDFFGTKAVGDNANFVLNCVENICGSKMLITARSRGRFGRPFKVISEIEKKAEKRTADRIEAVGVEIERYQKELDSLKGKASGGDTSLLQKEAVEKERKLQDRLMNARRELRELNKEKRVEIEKLIAKIKIYNMAVVPLAVPLLALAVFIAGVLKRRKHSGPKNEK